MCQVLLNSNAAGIKNHVFIIIGFPSETRQEFKETLVFLYSNRGCIHAIHDGNFGLQKGSFIFDNPKKFFITKILETTASPDSLEYSVSKGMTSDEAKAYKAFYGENLFQYFSFFSIALTSLRDHALLIYSNSEKLVLNKVEKAIPLIESVWPPLKRPK
ncbi:MAG: hypothetical protein KAJ62_10075 [Desulfobacteraceae bacterium]|nr:hypothetical protein [Desulfobacteraceae bacterium]